MVSRVAVVSNSFTGGADEQRGGPEIIVGVYSFTDGFFFYHQVEIAEKDKLKTTLITDWGGMKGKLLICV